MFSDILEYRVFGGTKKDLLDYLEKVDKVNIVSGNPEILMNGLNNEILHNNFLSEKSIIIPDGVGTVIASKIVGQPVKEKIAGIEVMNSILKKCNDEKKGVYLLGAKKDILEKCIKNITKMFPEIKICGSHDGYFDIDECENILSDIKNSKPYAIFVAMGSPKQEIFIEKYMAILPCKIYMGVGGSFDIIAGELKRAPKWMIKLGLEWLYRVCKEPSRIIRLSAIPKFLIKVITYHKNSLK